LEEKLNVFETGADCKGPSKMEVGYHFGHYRRAIQQSELGELRTHENKVCEENSLFL
jgi:hypothetical protein